MTLERLYILKRDVDTAIAFQESGAMMIDMTKEETNQHFIRAGACPGIHPLIIGQFAITDLNVEVK